MVPTDLLTYPRLRDLHSDAGQPALAGLPIAELYDGEVGRCQLDDVERALDVLAVRPATDVTEQKGKLFVAGWNHWDSTWLELLALSTLHGDGSLQATGWPATGYGDSPPFDGVILDTSGQNALIAFDVKSALGSGFTLLRERFQTVAAGWSAQQGLGPVDVGIRSVGIIPTREVVGAEMGPLLTGLRAALQQQTRLPATYTHSMQGGGTVTGTIDYADQITMNTAIGAPVDRTRSAITVMQEHIRSKATSAKLHQRPFLLIYVRPPGAGAADARIADIVAAAKALDVTTSSDWWLGTLLLDFSGLNVARDGYLRANGRWPRGSSPQTMTRTLRL